ncbi:uncharacterized protein LOC142628764 [Castanea sativa]|uniref:uncharacterized protein LOC142628764 n=1 Tax=Castanea sativa TaxID=21020 RepID=UPI003F64B37F
MAQIENPVIRFTEEDARGLHHPYDDAFIVSIRVGDYNTHRVLVDNGSSVDILYYPTFQQMRIEREWLVPTNAPLVRFRGMKVYPIGTVTLPMTIGGYPQQITKDITFLVFDFSSTYNALVGRLTLNSWKAVTSTYHLMIKLPTEYGSREVRGDQVVAHRPLRKAMSNLEAAGQKALLAIELSKFDVQYHLHIAIKGQVITDFIVEFTNTEGQGAKEHPQ